MPVVTPVNTPEPEPIVATAIVLLFHVPPGIVAPSVLVAPIHTPNDPVIAAVAFTVKVRETMQLPIA